MYRITITAGIDFDSEGDTLGKAEVALAIDELRSFFGHHYSGYTETQARGGWWDGNKLWEERAIVWNIIVDNPSLSVVEARARESAGVVATLLHQASVLVEVNHTNAFFIGKEGK